MFHTMLVTYQSHILLSHHLHNIIPDINIQNNASNNTTNTNNTNNTNTCINNTNNTGFHAIKLMIKFYTFSNVCLHSSTSTLGARSGWRRRVLIRWRSFTRLVMMQ